MLFPPDVSFSQYNTGPDACQPLETARGVRFERAPRVQSIEKPCGFFDAKGERLRASEILTDFRATR